MRIFPYCIQGIYETYYTMQEFSNMSIKPKGVLPAMITPLTKEGLT